MGVGGTYDVFTGHVKRAPKVWQNLGLEWLYRLLSQPTRIKRQLRLLRYLAGTTPGKCNQNVARYAVRAATPKTCETVQCIYF